MNEETLRSQLDTIRGEEPAPEVVERMRRQVHDAAKPRTGPSPAGDPVTLVDVERRSDGERRRPPTWPLVAAAVVLVGALLAVQAVTGDRSQTNVASTTEIQQVGDAWLRSIIDGDRAAFEALHAADVEVDDTLMGFSEDVDILTSARIAELYYDGFDALQADQLLIFA